MNSQADQSLIEKPKALPPARRAEVADFLAAKERTEALKDFLAVADQVAQAGVPALSPEEIKAELTHCAPNDAGTAHPGDPITQVRYLGSIGLRRKSRS